MVYLAIKIRRDKKLYDSTILVVTDRDDLDKQIYKTFLRTLHKYTEPVRARSITLKRTIVKSKSPNNNNTNTKISNRRYHPRIKR